MNEDESEPGSLNSRSGGASFSDFVQKNTESNCESQKRSLGGYQKNQRHSQQDPICQDVQQQKYYRNAGFGDEMQQTRRINSSLSLNQKNSSDLFSNSPREKKPLSTIIEQQSQIHSGVHNLNDRSQNSANYTNILHQTVQHEDIQIPIVLLAEQTPSLPDQSQSDIRISDSKKNTPVVASPLNKWVNQTFRYSMESRFSLLKSLNLQVHLQMNKVFFCLLFMVICLEQFIRTLATEISSPQTVQYYSTLTQQAISAVALALVQAFQPPVQKQSHFFFYFVQLFIILLQSSFSPTNQYILSSNLSIQAFMAVAYINIFSSFTELTFISTFFVVLNYRLRIQLYKQHNLQQCLLDRTKDPQFIENPSQNQLNLLSCFGHASWFDSLIYGTLLFSVLCLHAHQFLTVEALLAQNTSETKDETQFDKSDVGVYNCQTILGDVGVHQIFNSVDSNLALVCFESKPGIEEDENQIFTIRCANKSFINLLHGFDKNLKVATQQSAFQKFQFEKLMTDSTTNSEHQSQKNNESLSLISTGIVNQQKNFSLNELVLQLSKTESVKDNKIYIQVSQLKSKQCDTSDFSDIGNTSNQQTLLLEKQRSRSQKFDRPLQRRDSNFQAYWQDRDGFDADECIGFNQSSQIFELRIRPVLHEQKLCYSVQLTPLNKIIQKVLKQAKLELQILPKVFANEQSLQQLKQVIKYSQLVEQQISEFSGIPSRTTIVDLSHSSNSLPDQTELLDNKAKSVRNWTNTVFARYQYYLSSVWGNAVHVSYLQKAQLTAWHVKNKTILLNFQKVSKQTQSIENHVKEFMIQFSQSIEFKNLHVSVGMGQMPMEPLYTDWSIYNQALFQVVSNAVKFNKTNGAIAVSIYFQRDYSSVNKSSTSQKSINSSIEVGRIVTVVKDTGMGMSQLKQRDLFKIRTHLPNKAGAKNHQPQPIVEGVGLTTTQTLVGCLGGQISIISKEECGTQVTFDVQVTTYPLKNKVPQYKFSDTGQTLTFPFNLQEQSPNLDPMAKFPYRRVSENNFLKNKLTFEKGKCESICDSESINNEEELKMFEKVFSQLDLIENKSEGHLYCPQPPENSFYNQDYYLDESFHKQQQLLNDKSIQSNSNISSKLQLEEVKQTIQVQQPQLVYDVVSNQSSQQRVVILQPDSSLEPGQRSTVQQTVTTNRILSFADAIRSSISKTSPLQALVNSSIPSVDQVITSQRHFLRSEFKKKRTTYFRSEKMKQFQNSKVKKSPEFALSCDDVQMKVNNSSKEIEIKSKEEKQLSDDRRMLQRERNVRQNNNKSEENSSKREKSESNKNFDMQVISNQPNPGKQEDSLDFPLVFSSGISSLKKQISGFEYDERTNQAVQEWRQDNVHQDFTFQKHRESIQQDFGLSSSEMVVGSLLSQPGLNIEDSNAKQLSSIDNQIRNSVEQDEIRSKSLVSQSDNLVGSFRVMRSSPLERVDEVSQMENSDHQFSDLSIGESEHCFQQHMASGVIVLQESEKLKRLDEPPLQDRQFALSGLLQAKGAIISQKGGFNPVDQDLASLREEHGSLANGNKVSLKFEKHPTDSSDSQEKFMHAYLSKNKVWLKNADEKMKSQFSQLPSIKQVIDSKRKLRSLPSASSNGKSCKCKSILAVTNDPETASMIESAVFLIDANGIDRAQDCETAIGVLSLKLTAMCCTDTYDIIFITLESEFLKQNVTTRIIETIELWNEKLRSKGRKAIQSPQIIGITSEKLTPAQRQGVDKVLQKPIDQEEISNILVHAGGVLD